MLPRWTWSARSKGFTSLIVLLAAARWQWQAGLSALACHCYRLNGTATEPVTLIKENARLDSTIRSQLKAYLERLQQPIELIATAGEDETSLAMLALLREIATLSALVSVRDDGSDARRPSFAIGRPGEPARVHFAGIPMGHEFTSLVLALLQVGGYPP